MALGTAIRGGGETQWPGSVESALSGVGAWVAIALALAAAAYVATIWPFAPVAMLAAVVVLIWCSQRPVRWVYVLTATIFLESSDVSLYIGGARIRPAQIVLLPILATTALFTIGGMVRLRRVPLLVPLVLYLACNFLSTLFSPVPEQSSKVFLLLASLVILYIVTYLLVRDDPAAWPSVWRFFVWIGLLEIGVGLYQIVAGYANARLGLALPIGALGMVHTEYIGTVFGRPYGTLPEPDTYGAMCAFYAVLLGLMWLTASRQGRPWRLVAVTAAAATLGLVVGFVRASWFGFAIGMIWAFNQRLAGRLRGIRALRVAALGGLGLVVIVGVVAASPAVRDLLARRFSFGAEAAETGVSTENARFRQMVMSYRLFRERPLLGNGTGSFAALGAIGAHELYYISQATDLSRIYDPSILTTVLNDTGVLGSAAFVMLGVAYFGHIRRRLRRMSWGVARNRALAAHCALLGLFASFIFTHYFWLPFTWLFLAMTVLSFDPEIAKNNAEKGPRGERCQRAIAPLAERVHNAPISCVQA